MAIGDHLRDVMDLYGSPKCPHTNAVLIAAGEKGVDINSHVEDDWGPSSSIRSMSPLEVKTQLPSLAPTGSTATTFLPLLFSKILKFMCPRPATLWVQTILPHTFIISKISTPQSVLDYRDPNDQ